MRNPRAFTGPASLMNAVATLVSLGCLPAGVDGVLGTAASAGLLPLLGVDVDADAWGTDLAAPF